MASIRQLPLHQEEEIFLPQQFPQPDIPENDVGLVSYYLNCCVVGCEVPVDVPSEMLDYANVHRLPLEYQQAVYNVAIRVFQLSKLLNKIIFIDDNCNLLPHQASKMFLSNVQAMGLAGHFPSFATISTPTSGKIMICTSDWLKAFYITPIARYSQAVLQQTYIPTNQHGNSSLSGASGSMDRQNHVAKVNQKNSRDLGKEQHYHGTNNNYNNIDVNAKVDACCQEYIPMAVAVLIEEPRPPQRRRRNPHDEFSVSLFRPGQLVKLSALVYAALNDSIAIVQERSQDRVIVHIPGDPSRYSVKAENLIIVAEGSVDIESILDV